MLSELVDEGIADQAVVLVIARVVPVVEQCAHHCASLPPVVGWVENTRVSSKNVDAFIVDCCILRNKLFCDLGRDVLDRIYGGESATTVVGHGRGAHVPGDVGSNTRP